MERWVLGTCVEKDAQGDYTIEKPVYFNMPNILKINVYTASDGQTYTHIENDYIDVLLKEDIAHFLPGS